jgi:hypothetical protein
MVAKVISISCTLILTIIKAFIAPQTSATAIAARIATTVFCSCHTNMEITTATDIDAVEPTDKSNPPTDREIVIPIAIIVTMDMERKIFIILDCVKNLSEEKVKNITSKTIVKIVPYLYRKSNRLKLLLFLTAS